MSHLTVLVELYNMTTTYDHRFGLQIHHKVQEFWHKTNMKKKKKLTKKQMKDRLGWALYTFVKFD